MALKASQNNAGFIIATCALCGFLVAFFSSLSSGNEVSISLIRASIGMLIGAVLGKFLLWMLYSVAREIRTKKEEILNQKRMEELARQQMEEEGGLADMESKESAGQQIA